VGRGSCKTTKPHSITRSWRRRVGLAIKHGTPYIETERGRRQQHQQLSSPAALQPQKYKAHTHDPTTTVGSQRWWRRQRVIGSGAQEPRQRLTQAATGERHSRLGDPRPGETRARGQVSSGQRRPPPSRAGGREKRREWPLDAPSQTGDASPGTNGNAPYAVRNHFIRSLLRA
jgi:hypothetical protein